METRHPTGFTLVETLITAAILTTGLAACSILFSYSVMTNFRNHRRTTATILLCDKLEQLRSGNNWITGEHFEYVTIRATGEITTVPDAASADYMRTWRITDDLPRKATAWVSAPALDASNRFQELAVGTITAGPSF